MKILNNLLCLVPNEISKYSSKGERLYMENPRMIPINPPISDKNVSLEYEKYSSLTVIVGMTWIQS